MKVSRCKLEGILLIEPDVHADARGEFMESFRLSQYRALGIQEDFIQDNLSRSGHKVLRGMHFTRRRPQSQILTVVAGEIFDVVIDIRANSPTYMRWNGVRMGEQGLRQIYMPHGFAHGFVVLSDNADLHYRVSAEYDPEDNFGLRWNDPRLGITWPVSDPLVSERDADHPLAGGTRV